MPAAASRMAVAAVDGAAYLFGGRIEPDGRDKATTLRYDPVADAWQSLADMRGAGNNVSATTADREIWILGDWRMAELRGGHGRHTGPVALGVLVHSAHSCNRSATRMHWFRRARPF
jgi:hypothetical protein